MHPRENRSEQDKPLCMTTPLRRWGGLFKGSSREARSSGVPRSGNRPGHEAAALASDAAKELALFRLPANRARDLAEADPPAWIYIETTQNPASATRIRARRRIARGE